MHVTKVDVWWDAAQHTTLDISHFEKLPFHKKDDFSHSLPTRAFHPSPTSPPPPPPQLPVAPKHFKLQANRKQAGESYHDRQITMLQHYTNWPQAYRESVLFSSVVFWDVRAKVRKVEKWQSKECLEQCFVVKPQSTNDLLGSLFHFLFVHLISTQLSPAPSLFLSFWSNSSSYFDSNNYPHQLKETLSSLTELRSLITDGSDTLSELFGGKGSDYRLWSHTCETLNCATSRQHLSHRLESLCKFPLLWRDFLLTYISLNWNILYVANLTIPNINMYGIR